MKKLLLAIDGDNLIHRAYYATWNTPEPTSQHDYPILGVHTFFSMLSKVLRRDYYTDIVVAWDIRSCWLKRHAILEKYDIVYKDRRSGKTEEQLQNIEDIRKQKIIVHNILKRMGIPSIVSTKEIGVESDDILASLTKHYKVGQNFHTHIVSNDKDLIQLIDEKVTVLNPAKNYERITDLNCEEVFGVEPKYLTDYLALVGDSVDGIPGLYGVAHKTAIKLLSKHEWSAIKVEKAGKRGGLTPALNKQINGKSRIPMKVIKNLIKLDKDCLLDIDPNGWIDGDIEKIREWNSNPEVQASVNQLKLSISKTTPFIKELGI